VRVAVVTESFLPSANGVTTSVLRVLDHLRARGHDAVVVCPGPAPATYAGFAVRTLPSVPVRGFSLGLPSAAVAATLEAFAPDVVHVASPVALGAQALAAARRLGVPSVAVFQTDVAGYARLHRLGAAERPVWRWLRRVHDLADLTLAPSGPTLAELRRRGFRRLGLWGRGVDTVGFHPRHRDSPAGRALRGSLLDGREVLVGYVGRLAPEKDVERLRVVADLPGVRVVVVGDGPSRAGVRAALDGTGARLLGRLDGERLATAYAVLDVFVHTGAHETFGQTLQEAMASRVPVVAPACGGPLDVVDHGRTGLLVPPGDPSALRAAVADLVVHGEASRQVRLVMGETARRVSLGRTWESVGDVLLDHYAATVAGRPADAPAAVGHLTTAR
jgi:phosphatidylinositol alpha 1,6-mannosyltransferase